jgi:hypothetical protein
VLRAEAARQRPVPGVGPVLGAGLLAALPADLRDARAATAYAGLNPRQRERGASLRGRARLSQVGHARLRRLRYVPALAGLRWHPELRAQAARLEARGKTGKVMVAALMRKLLGLGVGVLKSGQPWHPGGRLLPQPAPAPNPA